VQPPPSGAATGVQQKGQAPVEAAADAVSTEPPEAPEPPIVEEAPIQPKWEVLEPKDQTDPVPHEICELKKLKNEWTVMAASVRGKLHAHRALWRDDAYAFGQANQWTIVAVSDGAGSAKWSRIGARIACDESVKALQEMLSGFALNETIEAEIPSEADLHRLKAFLTLGACAARDGVIREAHARGISENDLYATLLLVIHGPWKKKDVMGALQVGDGAIGIFTGDDKCTVLCKADHGEYSSETVFLTLWREIIKKPYDQRVVFSVKQDVRCIAAMCDGVSDDLFPEEKRLIELFVGNPVRELRTRDQGPLYGVLRQVTKQPREGEALKDWLRYEKKGSSDDRTLVLLYRG
jgi:hypothetical protein